MHTAEAPTMTPADKIFGSPDAAVTANGVPASLSVSASVARQKTRGEHGWSGQEKFTSLKAAKARAAELAKAPAGTLKDESLHIIHDRRADLFFVEDGTPMIRNFEKCLWSL